MRVTIFDYGAGNLHSLHKALALSGAEIRVLGDPLACVDAEILVLPGVGAFGHAATRLAPARVPLRDAIRAGLPTIGICLGMQLLFDSSEEGDGAGLGVVAGSVTRLDATRLPQIGWNTLGGDDPLVLRSGLETAYFANGYACRPADVGLVASWSAHESDRFPAIVRAHRAIGVQFHPEKSSAAGVRFLHEALRECAA
jgi:glutamine amidotransferase